MGSWMEGGMDSMSYYQRSAVAVCRIGFAFLSFLFRSAPPPPPPPRTRVPHLLQGDSDGLGVGLG